MRPLRIYIASPYTIGNQAENVRRSLDAAEQLAAAGHVPYVPLLNHFWHLVYPHEPRFWLEQDREWLLQCDALVRLPGPSAGADEEWLLAIDANLVVFASLDDFFARYPRHV